MFDKIFAQFTVLLGWTAIAVTLCYAAYACVTTQAPLYTWLFNTLALIALYAAILCIAQARKDMARISVEYKK
jgi:uncharacterized membrane protein